MRSTFIHVLRYLYCAVAGGVLFAVLFLVPFVTSSDYIVNSSHWLVLVPFPGAIGFVLVRAAVGLLVRGDPVRADRVTTILWGWFAVGGVMGWLVADSIYEWLTPYLRFRQLDDRAWWLIACVLTGAFVAASTGWLARRRGRLFLPIFWVGAFGVLAACWGSVAK